MELDNELEKVGEQLARMTSDMFAHSSNDMRLLAKTVFKTLINQGWECHKGGYHIVLDEDD